MKPRLLDLFCGAGGATKGYQRAGFYVVGVDIRPQPRYCGDAFVEGDALLFLAAAMRSGLIRESYDAIHASPPCQKYSWSARRWRDIPRADLLEPTREALTRAGLPYVIENVIGAPMSRQIVLCGAMFGLGVIRHRRFESNELLLQPAHPAHRGSVRSGEYVTVAGHGGDNIKGRGSRAVKQAAMGIDWMNDQELNEAIPPAYTEYIGKQLRAVLEQVA